MNMKISYKLELNQREAECLKMILGDLTDKNKLELGMTEEEGYKISDIYSVLPNKDDE